MAAKKLIAIGTRFHRWTVVGGPKSDRHGKLQFPCRCDCGTERSVDSAGLRRSSSKSCGCHNLERITKHGAARRGQLRSEYATWLQMRHRCSNQNDPAYKDYGGRGIRVAPAWDSFVQFLADMGPRPAGHSLDRINNDGNYESGNCRWAANNIQQRNKRDTVLITFTGETLCLKDWAKKLGLSYSRLRYRHQQKMTPQEILSTDSRRHRKAYQSRRQ